MFFRILPGISATKKKSDFVSVSIIGDYLSFMYGDKITVKALFCWHRYLYIDICVADEKSDKGPGNALTWYLEERRMLSKKEKATLIKKMHEGAHELCIKQRADRIWAVIEQEIKSEEVRKRRRTEANQ